LLLAAAQIGASDSDSPNASLGSRLRQVLLGEPDALICPACPGEPALRVNAATGLATEVPLPYEQVNDLSLFPDRRKILAATSSEKGKRSQLLVLSAESLAPLGRIPIPGNGRRLVIDPDGYFAYVLSHRPGGHPEGPGRWELLGVDLGSGEVVEEHPLPDPPSDIALSEGGGRLYVSQIDQIRTFTTRPLTASWFFRSPGDNRRVIARPASQQLLVLRDDSIAVFEPIRREPAGGSGPKPPAGPDDAVRVIPSPTHLVRLNFSPDGRLAVGAGRGLDQLLVLDATEGRVAGTWPEDSERIALHLEALDAAERARGPRGELIADRPGFSPPLEPPPGPAPPPAPPASGSHPAKPADSRPRGPAQPPLWPPGSGVEPSPSPQPRPLPPEVLSLEEVAETRLEGSVVGDLSLVEAVVLYGPDSITTEHGRAIVQPDGTYSFPLPPRGRYRLLVAAREALTLACQPGFHTIEVRDFGYRGLDFRVFGAIGRQRPAPGETQAP
jgi:hypothetical protein